STRSSIAFRRSLSSDVIHSFVLCHPRGLLARVWSTLAPTVVSINSPTAVYTEVVSEHYFTESPSSEAKTRELRLELAGREVTVRLTGLDGGTSVLLRRLPGPPAGEVFVLCCGWAPISLHSALDASDAALDLPVWSLVVNSRSLETTAANPRRLGLETVRSV